MRYQNFFFVGFVALALGACDFSSSRPQTDYPDQQSQGFKVYAHNCSECHAPPLPASHPAGEWPGVIARMQQHLTERSMPPISTADELVLRDYLIAHALED